MKSKLLHEEKGFRSYALIFQKGDEVIAALTRFAEQMKLNACQFTGIGAFQHCVLAYFDWEKKEYCPIRFEEQAEVLVLAGDITIGKKGRKIHAHTVISKKDGAAHGGHLLEGFVRPTLELIVHEMPEHLQRRTDSESGLALIQIEGEEQIKKTLSGKVIGKKRWAIPEGYIPPQSHGPAPEMVSHEAVCILNASEKDANIEITIFHPDREPSGPYEIKVPAKRTRHIRLNELKKPEPIIPGTEFSSLIESDIPVVVQHTRLDSRQAENALLSTMGFPLD